MKHPDDTDEALDFMASRARLSMRNGMGQDQALDEAVEFWRRSLLRSQMLVRFNQHLRDNNKPTLHVPLFEAAKIR
jgi:hypothetical protein